NVGQQVGGWIGLALLGTVAWTVMANTARSSAASVAAAARAGHPPAGTAAQIKAAIYDHALPVGFSRGFEVSAGIMLLTLIVTIVAIRLTREDLAGAAAATPGQPASAEPAVKPANS
ncbi:hypothetical protein, partial [Trebonia sp.]|uniref:hypothetical protein n=1 Tax=Trebonia sp. TaxID=2767075 RepID=UPI003BAF9255